LTNDALARWLLTYGIPALEFVGVLAFATSGLIEAARKKLDIVGMSLVAAMTAFGGGTVRDLLLDRRPFFWVKNEYYIWGLIVASVLVLLFVGRSKLELTSRAMQWPDAVGLGIFSASGTQVALSMGLSPIIAVVMGVLTAIIGGVLRDIVVNEIPQAFNSHEPYAVIAFVGCWVVVLMNYLGFATWLSVLVGASVIIAIRVMAILRGWKLPAWKA
jgi:uncharacterized membrane protein YeiH